jgi:hypothetical protein
VGGCKLDKTTTIDAMGFAAAVASMVSTARDVCIVYLEHVERKDTEAAVRAIPQPAHVVLRRDQDLRLVGEGQVLVHNDYLANLRLDICMNGQHAVLDWLDNNERRTQPVIAQRLLKEKRDAPLTGAADGTILSGCVTTLATAFLPTTAGAERFQISKTSDIQKQP